MKLQFITVLLFCSVLFAQDKSTSFLKHQIGIGATAFINSLFSSDDNAYALEFRYHNNNFIAYRAGLSYSQDNSENGFFEGGLKIGIDKCFSKTNKWEFYYGIDLLASLSRFKSNDKNLLKLGVTPFFGIMFKISNNFSLSTEPLLFINYNYLEDNDTFEIENTKKWIQAGLGKIGYIQLNFHF